MIESYIRKLVVPTSSHIPAIGSRLYTPMLPQTVTYPCAVFYSVSREEMHEASLMTDRIQFSCYAETLSSATAIADAIRDKLKRYIGPAYTGSTVSIIRSWVDNMVYIYDENINKHIKILDMFIQYN